MANATPTLSMTYPKKAPSKAQLEKWIQGKLYNGLESTAIVLGSITAAVIFYYLAVYVFRSDDVRLYFTITMTVSNLVAIFFSWKYFSATKCFGDEWNVLAQAGNKKVNEDNWHLVLFFFRMALNGYFLYALFTNDSIFDVYQIGEWVIFPSVMIYAFVTGLWFIEAAINIFSNLEYMLSDHPETFVCGDVDDLCAKSGIGCEEADIIKDLRKKQTVKSASPVAKAIIFRCQSHPPVKHCNRFTGKCTYR